MQVVVSTYTTTPRRATTTESFSLTCAPPSGTLPFAARMCANISRHAVLLDPLRAGGYPCGGPAPRLPYETVSVTVTVDGKATQPFVLEPRRCVGLGPTAVRIYHAAAKGDEKSLTDLERGLQCQDDFFPTLNGVRGETYAACVAGLYTPRIDRLVRIAKRAPALAAVAPARSFPVHIGAQLCPIRGTTIPGLCSVSIESPSSGATTISFELTWVKGAGNGKPGSALAHHFGHVVLAVDRVVSVTQSGPAPPPLGR